MALTVTINRRERVGKQRYRSGTIDFDSSYLTGGELLSAATLELSTVEVCIFAPSGGIYFEYDHTNGTVLARYPSGGATAPATAVAPTVSVSVPAGATPVTSTGAQPTLAPAMVAGIGKQVGSTTDLSGITGVRFAVWGT